MAKKKKKEVKPLEICNILIGAVSAIAALIGAITALIAAFK